MYCSRLFVVLSFYFKVAAPILDASQLDRLFSSVMKESSQKENDEFFTGRVHYGVSREDGEDKIGNHPVTYDIDGNIIIKIFVKPNAAKNIIGVTTKVECLGLLIAAPPMENKVNEEMLKFLARVLGIQKSALSIIEDEGNFKTVKVAARTMFIEDLLTKLMDAQYMKPSHIGHPDYMNIHYVDDEYVKEDVKN